MVTDRQDRGGADQRSAVDAGAVGDSDDEDDEGIVFDGVDNAKLALADPVSVLSRQLLTSRRTWINSDG